MPVRPLAVLVLLPLTLAGCAGRRHVAPAPVAATPAPPVAAASLPDGASPGMLVPEPLADGSFPTPNRRLSAAGTLWHLRAGLNVAALSCPDEQGAAIRAGYNGWLTRQTVLLREAATRYAAEDPGTFDDAMTRLYNFWSQTPVRPAFCAAAARVVADVAASDSATLPTIAAADLDALDRPFADFYRAYDAWRRGAPGGTVIAAAAVTPPGPVPRPRLTLDLSDLPVDAEVAGGR